MTEEQEEAIESLEQLINIRKNKAGQIKYDNCICSTTDIETVLNMLKEKDAEIEQKNEVLNRVYDFIWENDCCRYFSKKHALCNQVLNFDSCLGNCKRNCIKQYFERKATNNS